MKRNLGKALRKLKRNYFEKNLFNLNYGMIHSRVGDSDGVSIVMKQVEEVLHKKLKVPRRKIFYLTGNSKIKSRRITQSELLWDKYPINLMMLENYNSGYGGGSSEKIERAIYDAKKVIEKWISKNNLDILIAHNTSHPVNFIFAVALSRYYRDSITSGKKTPKYILWWHDSHLERKNYLNPPRDVENYLLEGVPGNFVEYILFINSSQFQNAKRYFKKLNLRNKGLFSSIKYNHDIIYNTTDTFINSFRDLQSRRFEHKVEEFIKDFKIKELLKKHKISLKDTFFILQHTRVVQRKRIDFALEYSYKILSEMKKRGMSKAIYFLVSGHSYPDGTKEMLIKLNKQLRKKYNIKDFFLVFAEDFYDKTGLVFEEYPKIFAKLGAISTYFSDTEGFGNNLLEVLASGVIPVVYTYPVYKKDIAKYKFKTISFKEFELSDKKINETLSLIKSNKKRMEWINYNLDILRKHFPHKTMALKLKHAILSKRTHI